jgi:hypothetical protein
MPGDINSYALGIEFNLTATKALDTLQTIGDQVMKIQKAFESPINVSVQQSTELKANVAITENAAEINDKLILGYENQARSLQDYTDILQQTTKTQDEYDRVMIKHGDTIKDAAKEHEKLEKLLGYEDETVIKLGDDIKKVKEIDRAFKLEIKENAKAWSEWEASAKNALKSADTGSKTFTTIVQKLTGIKIKIDSTQKAMSGAVSQFAKMGKASGQTAPPLIKSGQTAAQLASNLKSVGVSTGGMAGAMGKANPYLIAAQLALGGVKKLAGAAGSALAAMGMDASASGKAIITLVTTLNPLKAALSFIVGAIKEFVEMEEALRTVTFRSMGTIDQTTSAVTNLRGELNLTNKEATETIAAMAESGITMIASRKEIEKLSKSVAKFSVATNVSQKTVANFVKVMTATGKSTKQVHAILGRFTIAMEEAGLSTKEMTGILEEIIALTPELQALFSPDAPEQFGNAIVALTSDFKAFGGSQKEAISLMKKIMDPGGKVAIMTGILGSGITDVGERAKALAMRIEALGTNWNEMTPYIKNVMAKIYGLTGAEAGLMMQSIKTAGSIEKWTENLRKKNEEAAAAKALDDKWKESVSTLAQELKRLAEDIIPELVKIIKQYKPAIVKAMKGLRPLIASIIEFSGKMVKTFVSLMPTLTTVLKIIGVVGATAVGFFEGMWLAVEPLVTAIALIGSLLWNKLLLPLAKMLGLVKKGQSSFGGLISVFRLLGKVAGVLTAVLVNPFLTLLHIVRWVANLINGVLFGSSFLHIKEGIAVIMKPLTWLRDAFVWVWEKVTQLSGTVGNFFGKVIGKGVKIASIAIKTLTAPLRAVGAAVSWVKKKLFGSSMFHFKEGASALQPAFAGLGRSFSVLGDAAELQKTKLAGMNDQVLGQVKGWATMTAEMKRVVADTHGLSVRDMESLQKAAVDRTAAHAGALVGDRGVVRPVRREIEQEMGRETKEAKQTADVNVNMRKLLKLVESIADILGRSDDPAEIINILREYLPKMSEKPSDLGPAVGRW